MQKFQLLLFFCIYGLAKSSLEQNNTKHTEKIRVRRILGGGPVAAGDAPYIVYVESDAKFCSGVLITDKTVLTTVDCQNAETIKIGTISKSQGTEVKIMHKTINCPEMEITERGAAGLVLFELENKIQEDQNIKIIKIEEQDVYGSKESCTIFGWGISSANEKEPDNLHGGLVNLIEDKDCLFDIRTALTYCVGGSYPCFNDRGSPMVCNGKLIGLIVTTKCGMVHQQSEYSKLVKLMDFVMFNKSVCPPPKEWTFGGSKKRFINNGIQLKFLLIIFLFNCILI